MTICIDARREDDSREAGLCLLTVVAVLAVVGMRMVCVALSGVPLSYDGTDRLLALCGLPLVGLGLAYLRRDMRLAAPLLGAGLVLCGIVATGQASDLAFYFGRGFPLVDATLAGVDRALGFDWMGSLHWFDAHPAVSALGLLAYKSAMPQAPLLVLWLAVGGQVRRACTVLLACNIGLLLTSLIAYRFPALGAYTYWGATKADHPNIPLMFSDDMRETIAWLRAATFRSYPDGLTSGLISFPSFHAVCAVIYVWAAWRTPLRWPVLALNIAMAVVTPVEGSHHAADVLAGFAVAAVSIVLAHRLLSIGAAAPDWARRRASLPVDGTDARPGSLRSSGRRAPPPIVR